MCEHYRRADYHGQESVLLIKGQRETHQILYIHGLAVSGLDLNNDVNEGPLGGALGVDKDFVSCTMASSRVDNKVDIVATSHDQQPADDLSRRNSHNMAASIPSSLLQGVPMIKITKRKVKQRVFRLVPEPPGPGKDWLQSTLGLSAPPPSIQWESRRVGKVRLDQIREIRYGAFNGWRSTTGEHAELPPGIGPASASRWITIVYISDGLSPSTQPSGAGFSSGSSPYTTWKELNMVALSDQVFQLWVDTLSKMLAKIRRTVLAQYGRCEKARGDPGHDCGSCGNGGRILGVMGPSDSPAPPSDLNAVEALTMSALTLEADESRCVGWEEVVAMCRSVGLSSKHVPAIEASFKAIDTDGKHSLGFRQFRDFVQQIKGRSEIRALWLELSSDDSMSGLAFARFLIDHQGLTSESAAAALFQKYAKGSVISYDGFRAFLTSHDNPATDSRDRQIYQDMTRPLPEYYLSSSHNTYLLASQWKGESSVEGYIRALLSGCRTVEIDCYDGNPEPVIYHGKTFTVSVPVRQVCLAIAGYAFMASPYPIIISAEVHCDLEQQVILATILKETFGSALVQETDILAQSELPSPEQLKYRILFKTKTAAATQSTSPILAEDGLLPSPSSSTETTESEADLLRPQRTPSFRRRFHRLSDTFSRSPESTTSTLSSALRRPPSRSSSVDSSSSLPRKSSSTISAIRISPALDGLLVYAAGVKYRGFSKLIEYRLQDMFSLSEKTASKIAKQSPMDLVKHNRTHLTRIYPHGTRLTSSNYLPNEYWALGSQLVAINWQTSDLGHLVNCAMFSRNGRCGYVLKPEALRVKTKDALRSHRSYRLDLSLLSGQSLWLPPDLSIEDSRLYVEASVHPVNFNLLDPKQGLVHRCLRLKSGAVSGNSFNPVWNFSGALEFQAHPELLELVFLRIEIKHQPIIGDDLVVAQFCCSVSALQRGYRHLPVYDRQMTQFLHSTIFVKSKLGTM